MIMTPLFLARELRDAHLLVDRLGEAQIEAEVSEVEIGEGRRGWQVAAATDAIDEARRIAERFEKSTYGHWKSRAEDDAVWGVVSDEQQLLDPTSIYSAKSPMEAHFLKNLLADEGITAVVSNQLLHGGAGIDLVGMPTAAQVVVAAQDVEAARRFAVEFDMRSMGPSTPLPDVTETETEWPTCPGCEARRTTRCPICETSGTDFVEADRDFLGELTSVADAADGCSAGCGGSCSDSSSKQAASCPPPQEAALPNEALDHTDHSPHMLMCSVCDEPFLPAYPKNCEWCGYEFPDGYVVERIVGPEEIPGRAIAVVVGLGVLVIAAMIYFVVILGS